MSLFVNDLSLAGQFATSQAATKSLLDLRNWATGAGVRIYVTRSLLLRNATAGDTLFGALSGGSQAERTVLLSWLTKNGPFGEDARIAAEDDLWFLDDDEVTDQGLGHASRHQLVGLSAASFSFSHPISQRFHVDALNVIQGFVEEPVGRQIVANVWTKDGIGTWVAALAVAPSSWAEFITAAVAAFPHLKINEASFSEGLTRHPFHQNVVSRGMALMDVLNRIAAGLQSDGSLDEAAMALMVEHFQGGKAWFSDETPSNENVFMFPDHTNGNTKIYCSWHGKVKTPQFRMHFEWPVPPGQHDIKVLYFGEKLTKT